MNNEQNLQLVTNTNLEVGKRVIDNDHNTGIIISIEDIHNVEVRFDNGGGGLWCFAEDCDEALKDALDPLYYCEPQTNVSGSLRSNAIEFAKWLQHLDNGTTHYNPFTKEESESIGFSPYDCLINEHNTIEELYNKWRSLSNDR